MAGDHHAHGHHAPDIRPSTSSRPIFPLPGKGHLRAAAGLEIAFWIFCMWGVRETYAVKLGWRHKFETLGHPFENGGLKGGKFGSWLSRHGLVSGAGDRRL